MVFIFSGCLPLSGLLASFLLLVITPELPFEGIVLPPLSAPLPLHPHTRGGMDPMPKTSPGHSERFRD